MIVVEAAADTAVSSSFSFIDMTTSSKSKASLRLFSNPTQEFFWEHDNAIRNRLVVRYYLSDLNKTPFQYSDWIVPGFYVQSWDCLEVSVLLRCYIPVDTLFVVDSLFVGCGMCVRLGFGVRNYP